MITKITEYLSESLERYQAQLFVISAFILISSFVGSLYYFINSFNLTNEPSFVYLPEEGNGEILPVCEGDNTVRVRIVGDQQINQNLEFESFSVSIVVATMVNIETGQIVHSETKYSLGTNQHSGRFDFVNKTVFPVEFAAGDYTYNHAFFTVSDEGASHIRGFQSFVTVEKCS